MRRSHLRHKCKSKRRNEELGYRQDEVEPYHNERSYLNCRKSFCRHRTQCVFCGKCQREKHQKYVCERSDAHTDTNLHRCRHFFAPLFEKSEEPHDKRCQRNHKERIYTLKYLCTLDGGETKIDIYHVEIHVVASEIGERVTVLVEREPEEDNHSKYGEKCVYSLPNLVGRHLDFFFRMGSLVGILALACSRIGKFVLVYHKNDKRNHHHQHCRHKCVLETSAEYVKIVAYECSDVGRLSATETYLACVGRKFLHIAGCHSIALSEVLMAEFG